MAGKNPFRSALIAPCGMDCAICMAYLREKNHCPGCATTETGYKRKCTIASCPQVKDRYLHTCDGFPCRRLKELDKRYRTRYGMSMLGNIEAIRQNGIRAFLKSERERWKCPACGETINVHRGRCSACGREREAGRQEG